MQNFETNFVDWGNHGSLFYFYRSYGVNKVGMSKVDEKVKDINQTALEKRVSYRIWEWEMRVARMLIAPHHLRYILH